MTGKIKCHWWFVGAVVVVLALGVLGFTRLGAFLSGTAGAPVKADIIFALGGDSGYRTREVGRLFKAGWAPRVRLTGIEASPPEMRARYLDWRAQILADLGVPASATTFDTLSANSWEEAVNARISMEQNGWKRALVVSDPPHLRRLDWTWGKAFAGSGLEYVLVAAPNPWWNADEWWRNEIAAKFVAQEAVKLAYYVVAR